METEKFKNGLINLRTILQETEKIKINERPIIKKVKK